MVDKKIKQNINVVFIGNFKSGKSDTVIQLVSKFCQNNKKKELKDNIPDSSDQNNNIDWILSKMKVNKLNGGTSDISTWKIQLENHDFSIIDTPGNRKYFKNTIVGISKADVAVLVVSAENGEFEAGISNENRTSELAIIALSLGIKKIILAINKIDISIDPENRFYEIKDKIINILRKIGYQLDNIKTVAYSAYTGDNIFTKSTKFEWYNGDTLTETLEMLQPISRDFINKPLRIPIERIIRINENNLVAIGTVHTGCLKKGQNLSFLPSGLTLTCESIQSHNLLIDRAVPGDYIGIKMNGFISHKLIKKGFIGSDLSENIEEITSFEARIIILNELKKIKTGFTPTVYCHTSYFACKFEKILWRIDKRTGLEFEAYPKEIRQGNAYIIKMRPMKRVYLETLSTFHSLSRLVIRDCNKTIAVGTVLSVKRKG